MTMFLRWTRRPARLIWEHRSGHRSEHQHRLLRLGQSRRRAGRRESFSRLSGRHVRRAGRRDGKTAVADAHRPMAGRLYHHVRAALLQRRRLYRRLRRRHGRARQGHRARRQNGQGTLAFLDSGRPGRNRRRHLASAERCRSEIRAKEPPGTGGASVWQAPGRSTLNWDSSISARAILFLPRRRRRSARQ